MAAERTGRCFLGPELSQREHAEFIEQALCTQKLTLLQDYFSTPWKSAGREWDSRQQERVLFGLCIWVCPIPERVANSAQRVCSPLELQD